MSVSDSDPQILVTTFPSFEDAHEAIALLNEAEIPSGIEVSTETCGGIAGPEAHARRVAITVPASRLHDARMAIRWLRASAR